eukprot:TRINITY_DN2492_c0_g1_i5.p2 TRINITY_DN2492_c0_g1~~TRINITY_DN2492_c0_g1_i5.p2  ORF type:complete len:304 (+),score=102.50 TRINITY_DN2492_c0_g1_i5:68-913(+)
MRPSMAASVAENTGRRRTLALACATFCVGALVCALAPRAGGSAPEVREFGSAWAPICRYLPGEIQWQPGSLTPPPGTLCLNPGRGHGSFSCQESHHVAPRPGDSGAWGLDENYAYFIDLSLAEALSKTFANSSVMELGAGKGCYSAYMTAKGVRVTSVDGAPGITRLTNGAVTQHDLTIPAKWAPRDWVMCLEVAEHVPAAHEDALLDNMHRHNTKGLVLSWAVPGQDGRGHVNERPNDYVVNKLARLGYRLDAAGTATLRASISKLPWFRSTLMKFDRVA